MTEIRLIESTNDSGQTVFKRVDVAEIRRRQIRSYRIGKFLAFIAPVLIPVLDGFSWAIRHFINEPLSTAQPPQA